MRDLVDIVAFSTAGLLTYAATDSISWAVVAIVALGAYSLYVFLDGLYAVEKS